MEVGAGKAEAEQIIVDRTERQVANLSRNILLCFFFQTPRKVRAQIIALVGAPPILSSDTSLV